MFNRTDFNIRRLPAVILSVFILLLADRVTKNMALDHLAGQEPFSVIPNVLLFTYVENRGIAFGMFQGKAAIFVVIAAVVSLLCLYGCLRLPSGKRYMPVFLCLSSIISGALGNMADRLMYGFVVDFIYFKPIDFPVFNVADIYITCGAFILVFLLIFVYKEDEFSFII